MSDENFESDLTIEPHGAPPPRSVDEATGETTYSGGEGGLRAAARDRAQRLGEQPEDYREPPKPATGDDKERTLKQAKDALAKFHAVQEADQAIFDEALAAAMGDPEAAATVTAAAAADPDEALNPAVAQQLQQDVAAASAAVQEWTKAANTAAAYATRLQQAAHLAVAGLVRDFPGIESASVEQIQDLARTNPALYTQLMQRVGEIQQVTAVKQQADAEVAQLNNTVFDRWAQGQDTEYARRHPEIVSNPVAARAMADAAVYVLHEAGLSDQEIRDLWAGKLAVSLRDHRVQDLLTDAVRYRAAQHHVKTTRVKPLPAVQRPGVRSDVSPSQHGNIQAALRQMKANPSPRNAAKLLQARRAAGMVRV
jgi:hypothetical protein